MISEGAAELTMFIMFVMLPSLQVKKLVYVYLVRYAEEQQDLALLSISTFQRGLKVPVIFPKELP